MATSIQKKQIWKETREKRQMVISFNQTDGTLQAAGPQFDLIDAY